MAQTHALLSVLDRLLDDDPKRREDAPVSRANSGRQFKEAVRRDIEWLLNTRCIPDKSDEQLDLLHASVYAYGLPDFGSYGMGSGQARLKLRRALEHALETFEPRLINVVVTPIEGEKEDEKRIVRFLISGLLRMDPAPEQVSFDTLLELSRGEYKISKD